MALGPNPLFLKFFWNLYRGFAISFKFCKQTWVLELLCARRSGDIRTRFLAFVDEMT